VSEPLLELAGFSFSIESRAILRDVSFRVADLERVAVIGPNGAGKTTLLKCVVRILRGGRGRIAVDGRPIEEYAQAELARRVAYVPQADARPVPFTVREFVGMARYPHLGPLAPSRPEDERAVARALEDTGTATLADRTMDTLSGGERQKCFLAAGLAQEARLLLLDEPTAFLDPAHKAEILGTLARVHGERGGAVLFVTHDVNEALARAGRVIALREGAVAFDGPGESLTADGTLRAVYAHDFAIGPHPRTGRAVVFP